MQVRLQRQTLRLRSPLRTAFGRLEQREILLLSLTGQDGVTGRGEAAPLEPYDGVPAAAVEAALRLYAELLQAAPEDAPGITLLEACRERVDLPQALAAVDLALWDRAGRRAGRPVSALLADEVLDRVPVNATIGAGSRGQAAAAAGRAAAEGYTCVKLKVGTGDDPGRVAAVRAAAGPAMALRLDANGAWSVEQAVAMIGALEAAGLELVEEPVHGLGALAEVRGRVTTRIGMDETAAEAGALTAAVADAVCLKISRCGGISALLAQAALVRTTGAEAYVASSFDGPLGIAAALHAAAALRVELPCGLGTLDHFDEPVPEALAVRDGHLTVPRAPGLL